MRNLILGELEQARRLESKHVEAFIKDGVPLRDLADSMMRRSWIVVDGDRFEFHRYAKAGGAREAFIFRIWDSCGDLADIAAWRPGHSLTLWLGNVAMLGEEQTLRANMMDPLPVFTSTLDWFRAARAGIVIIDHARAASILRWEKLGAKNVAHAQVLRKALTLAPPSIVVLKPVAPPVSPERAPA